MIRSWILPREFGARFFGTAGLGDDVIYAFEQQVGFVYPGHTALTGNALEAT